MAVRRRDYPHHRDALAIVKALEPITHTGHGQDDVFEDWLELCEATLSAFPAHARSIAQHRQPAEDTDEVKALWKRVGRKYETDREGRKYVWDCFSKALGLLLSSAFMPDGSPDYKDLLGDIYMAWGWPNRYAGQFFTPWPVAEMMARMTIIDGEVEIYERLTAAYLKSPVGLVHQLMGASREQIAAFVRRIGPNILAYCADKYEPISVCDCCVGSAVMLLAAARQYPAWAVQMGLVQFFGADIDMTCVRMARINFMIYGMNGFGLRCYVSMAEGELARLPLTEPQRETIEAAREATDQAELADLALQLRYQQVSLFDLQAA